MSVRVVNRPNQAFSVRQNTYCLKKIKPSTPNYVFPNADPTKPFLEEPITGPTSRFCLEVVSHLRCCVSQTVR